MFRDREHLYREVADAVVDVDGRDVGEVVDAMLDAMGRCDGRRTVKALVP